MKLVEVGGYYTYNNKVAKYERKEESNETIEAGETEEAQEAPVFLVTHVNTILDSIFSIGELYINNQQIYNCIGFYPHKFCISNNFMVAISNTREFCNVKGITIKNVPMTLWTHSYLNHFLQGTRKRFVDPMVSCCIVNRGLTFSLLHNCRIHIINPGYD